MSSKTATSASSSSTSKKNGRKAAAAPEGAVQPASLAEIRFDAPCRHFGECGGCQIQDLDYSAQLQKKAEWIESLVKPVGWEQPVKVAPSPQVWYYRNKMEFSFQDVYPVPAPGEDHLLLGLKRKKRWDKVMNLSECRLMSPEVPALLESVHGWARDEKLEPYNLHRQTGFLRHLLVREGKNTGDRMVLLLTNQGPLPKESFAAAVQRAYPATTIMWGINGKIADIAKSDGAEILTGSGTIHEELLGRRLRISPYSFFQTNTNGAAALYGRIREIVRELAPKNLLDLYCGSGGITLCVADAAQHAIGVEIIASAVEDARHNAGLNKISNAEFMQSSVEDLLPTLASQSLEIDSVVLDPPRSGLHPTAMKALKELAAPNVIYVSCNPKALAEDLRKMADFYEIKSLEGFDLFPHTEHVETLVVLKARY